jgi:pSer/pThr/pTyr-binding forkhead associated (FHA) protein
MQHDDMDGKTTAEIALILVFRGETEIERRAFAIKETIAIGRDPFTDIILEDPTVSRLHVELRREGNDLVLYDKSSNGTTVNGKSVTRHVVNDRDVISLGRFTLIVELHADSKSSLYEEAHAEGWTMDDEKTMKSAEMPPKSSPKQKPKPAA